MSKFLFLFSFLIGLNSYAVQGFECKNSVKPVAWSTTTKQTSDEFNMLKDIFGTQVTQEFFSLLKTYVNMSSDEQIVDEVFQKIFQTQKINGSQTIDITLIQNMKESYQSYSVKIKKYKNLNTEKKALINLLLDYKLFLIGKNSVTVAQENTLSQEENFMVYAYTSGMYSMLNRYLYQSLPCNSAFEEMKTTLNRALKKLKTFQGLVRRGLSDYPTLSDEYCNGCIVNYKAFLSTSSNLNSNRFPYKYKLIMSVMGGKEISSYSNTPDEAEILLGTGSKFKVDRIDGDVIYLTELDASLE